MRYRLRALLILLAVGPRLYGINSGDSPMLNRFRRILLRTIAALVIFIGPARTVHALGQDRAEAELDRFTAIEFKDIPLKDAAEFLSAQHKVRFILAPGVQGDVVITCNFQGIKLREALDGMLRPHKLGFEAKDGVILFQPAPAKK